MKQNAGLDITNKTGLVSINYTVWFDAIFKKSGGWMENWNNTAECLAGTQEWGPKGRFHYWSKPAMGYYCSSNKEVIRTHMKQLSDAGVDFIVIDLTNAHDSYLTNGDWTWYIEKPMDAICETITEMRNEGFNTPYVAFWTGDSDGPLYKALYDRYCNSEKWKDCFVFWNGKPFMFTTQKLPEDFPLPELFTVRRMWGLGTVKHKEGHWSFLSGNNYDKVTVDKDGNPEQVSVTVASQETYMTAPTAHERYGGLFWYAQWLTAFKYRPKVVGLTWWNEWTAQRFLDENGNTRFVDAYTPEFSRDIEPMEGGHGDRYYKWMKQYIAAYKNGEECPVLIEEEYKDKLESFLEAYRNGTN